MKDEPLFQHRADLWIKPSWLGFHVIRGNGLLHERVLLHEPSGTLVVTDAIEHFGHLWLRSSQRPRRCPPR